MDINCGYVSTLVSNVQLNMSNLICWQGTLIQSLLNQALELVFRIMVCVRLRGQLEHLRHEASLSYRFVVVQNGVSTNGAICMRRKVFVVRSVLA